MADVGGELLSADGDDRGQLLLVGALTLAVMLVALAVLLNAAIYTGNVATRDAGPGAGEAIEYEDEATSMARDALDAKDHEEWTDYATLEANFSDTVDGWSQAAGAHAAVALADANLSTSNTARGTYIVQSSDRNFTDAAGNSTWTVANDTQVRAFRMNVSQSSLAPFEDTPITNDSFRVTFNDSVDEWGVYLHQGPTDNVSVTVQEPDESDSTCTVDPGADDRAVVDLTAGTVAGEPCPGMHFLGNLSGEYTVEYVAALNESDNKQVFGTYSLVVNRSIDDLDTGADTAGSVEPTATRALYSADLEVTYRSSGVYYRSTFRVAPGEANDE